MFETLAVPVWLIVVTGVLAVWALVDRLLLPSVRWALRRRANRAIDKLNSRLQLKIQPFKLTRRQVLIDRLIHDPDVAEAVDGYAAEEGVPRAVAMEKATRYAREIVPSFSAYAYFKFGAGLARRVSTALYRVRLGYLNDEALRSIPTQSSVVFVINHRSNMDYLLVTYLASTSSALSYAVGEWAQVWGLRNLVRSMGAYFIRRNSRNALYRKVLARYVHMATSAGVTQAMFPEGGLSRDGLLQPPKLGLLNYMVSGFDPRGERDIVFVPVGVNYDRVLEDRVLTSTLSSDTGKRPKFRFNPLVLLRFIGNSFWLMLRGRWYRYGYTCVSFGEPVSLRGELSARGIDLRTLDDGRRQSEVLRIADTLMDAVGRIIPALPVSLVSTALLEAGAERLTEFELKGRVFRLIETLEARGAHIHIPRNDRAYAIDVGLRMLKMRKLMIVEDDLYAANADERVLLQYYANAIVHLLPTSGTAIST